AQDRKQRLVRSEESRIEIKPARVEEAHQDEEADLPAAEDERRLSPHFPGWRRSRGDLGHRRGRPLASAEGPRDMREPSTRVKASFPLADAEAKRAPGAAPGLPRRTVAEKRSVLEALPNLVDIVFRHELGSGVKIRGGYVAVDLQVQLHDRVKPLQERLLAERALQSAGLDLLELL